MPIYTEDEQHKAYVRACDDVESLRRAQSLEELTYFKGHALGYAQCLHDEDVLSVEKFESLQCSLENVVAECRVKLDRRQ